MERFPSLTPRPELYPTGTTILRAIVVARWLAWTWMAGIVAFDDQLVRPVVGWAAVAATLGLTALSTALVRTRPERLLRAWFVGAEVALALSLSILDGFVFAEGHVFATTQSLATQWPLLAMATAGVAYGPVIAAAFGALTGPAEWLGAVLNGVDVLDRRQLVSIVATSLFYAACGGVFGWQARLLRRVEGEIADRRARDEIGRVLHDTVLQTLALVERRSVGSDPELAAAARAADRDLRSFLFGGTGRRTDDLAGYVRAEVDRVGRGQAVPVSVNVLDDGCRLDGRAQELVARAIAEAVANALEHAEPSRVVVFVETDDDGGVFASIDDDGIGFDTEAHRSGHGISQSIVARIESIGGRVSIESAPGNGTEVCLWIAPAGSTTGRASTPGDEPGSST